MKSSSCQFIDGAGPGFASTSGEVCGSGEGSGDGYGFGWGYGSGSGFGEGNCTGFGCSSI